MVVRDGRAPASPTLPASSCSRAGPPTPRSSSSCRRTTRTRAASRTAPTWSAGTTCSTTAVPYWRCRAANPTRFQKTLSLNDFYFGADDFEFPLGNVQMIGKSQGPCSRVTRRGRFAPGWTLEKMAEHAVDFWLTTEDLPEPDNRVTLRRPRRGGGAPLHLEQPGGDREDGCPPEAPGDAEASRLALGAPLPERRSI